VALKLVLNSSFQRLENGMMLLAPRQDPPFCAKYHNTAGEKDAFLAIQKSATVYQSFISKQVANTQLKYKK